MNVGDATSNSLSCFGPGLLILEQRAEPLLGRIRKISASPERRRKRKRKLKTKSKSKEEKEEEKRKKIRRRRERGKEEMEDR